MPRDRLAAAVLAFRSSPQRVNRVSVSGELTDDQRRSRLRLHESPSVTQPADSAAPTSDSPAACPRSDAMALQVHASMTSLRHWVPSSAIHQ